MLLPAESALSPQAALGLSVLLSLPRECWDHGLTPPCMAPEGLLCVHVTGPSGVKSGLRNFVPKELISTCAYVRGPHVEQISKGVHLSPGYAGVGSLENRDQRASLTFGSREYPSDLHNLT